MTIDFQTNENRKLIRDSVAEEIFSKISDQPVIEKEAKIKSDYNPDDRKEEKKSEEEPHATQSVQSTKEQPFEKIKRLITLYRSNDEKKDKKVNNPSDLTTSKHRFSDAILELNLLADREKGINSEYKEVEVSVPIHESKSEHESKEISSSQAQVPKVKVLYRDASNPLDPEPTPYANWAIIGLNYIHAAIKLSEIVYGKKVDKEKITKIALAFMENIKESDAPEETLGRMIHSALIPYVKELLPNLLSEDIEEQLAQIRDFNNFDQPTFVVATRSKIDVVSNAAKKIHGDSIDHLEIDVPMTGGLTPNQRKEYEAIKKDNIDANNGEDKKQSDKLTLPKWYQEQPDHIKKLIKHHADDVLAGRMISNQLRKQLAGVRNGGHDFIYVKSKKTKGQPKCIFETYHTSNPAHEHTDTAADKQNIRQLGQLMGADHVVLCDLTSNVPIIGEGEIPYFQQDKGVNPRTERAVKAVEAENDPLKGKAKQTQKKHEKENVHDKKEEPTQKNSPKFHHSKLPAHLHRIYLSNKYDGVDFIRQQAVYIRDYLDRKLDPKVDAKEISHIKTKLDDANKLNDFKENKKRLNLLISEYDEIRTLLGRSLLDDENNNLILASIAAELVFYVNELCGPNYLALDEFCKSGKDRGGLLRLMMSIDATTRFITEDIHVLTPSDKIAQRDEVAKSLTRSNQIGAQAGYIGNVLGASGVLGSVKYALPAYLKQDSMSPISAKTARYNKKIPKNPDRYNKKIPENPDGYDKKIPKKPDSSKKSKSWVKGLLYIGGVLVGGALCATGIGAVVGVPIIATAIITGSLGLGVTMASTALIAKKHEKKKSFYKNPYFWLGLVGAVVGLGLCATGIGAAIGVPLFAASITGVGGTILAAVGALVGVGGTVSAINTASNKKSSMTLVMLAMAGLGAVLCMTGIGAIIGVPLIAATITMAIVSTSSVLIAGSTLLSSTAKEGDTPFYKKPRFWLALGATLVGLALCATGVGAAIGLPLIGASTIMYASTVALGVGSTMMTAPVLTSKTASPGTKVLAIMGGIIGIGLCLTGIGALAGYPLLQTLGFLGKAGADITSKAVNTTSIPTLASAAAVASIRASGTGAAKTAKPMPKPKLSKKERALIEMSRYENPSPAALPIKGADNKKIQNMIDSNPTPALPARGVRSDLTPAFIVATSEHPTIPPVSSPTGSGSDPSLVPIGTSSSTGMFQVGEIKPDYLPNVYSAVRRRSNSGSQGS